MANNQMFLTSSNGQELLLAEYFPSTGWKLISSPENFFEKELASFLDRMRGWEGAAKPFSIAKGDTFTLRYKELSE